MKVLVCGLGSMGRRRIQCLLALGFKPEDITGYDLRKDRCGAAQKESPGIRTWAAFNTDLNCALRTNPQDAMIISVPPDVHHFFIDLAIKHHIPAFVEASVVTTGIANAIKASNAEHVLIVPSSTFRFHPAIQIIKKIVDSGELGTISNVIYHIGQWLPDWHTYESPADYYVSHPETGAAREMVPFELTWLTWVFGIPEDYASLYGKTVNIPGAERITDTYNILLEWTGKIGVLVVDVVSRHMIRRLVVNGSKQQLLWDWDEKCVKVFDPEKGQLVWEYDAGSATKGYNYLIGNRMYVEELSNFLNAINGTEKPANTLEADLEILHLLERLEGGMHHG